MNEIMVSIDCITFNHEDYIREALDSFLAQKTTFNYEILIHDDASTDKTADIIKKYQRKYPDIIKPILQKENQYSKGVKVASINAQRAEGKYIAICEGDDYWNDIYKLQKQVDFMEEHPETSLFVHNGYEYSEKQKKNIRTVLSTEIDNRFYSVEQILVGGGALFPTNSMLYRKEFVKNLPAFYFNAPIGDYPMTIYLGIQGDVYYSKDIMSSYRVENPQSWAGRQFVRDENYQARRISHKEKILKMFEGIDEYTNGRYKETIEKLKLKTQFSILIYEKKYKSIKSKEYTEFYKLLSRKDKVVLFLEEYFPSIISKYYEIKGRII